MSSSKVLLGLVLWLAGMCGVLALSFSVIPQLGESLPDDVPLSFVLIASMVQSALLLALATWAGVAMSGKLGFAAPAVEAALRRDDVFSVLKWQLAWAIPVGTLVGLLLHFLGYVAPASLSGLSDALEIPLVAKVLYGGITEELLMRWGLMTLLVWLPWRIIQKRRGAPKAGYIVAAIVLSAVLFGLGHLPAVAAMGGELSPSVVLFVVVANTVPGILFGVLFWRHGLEAAIMAHGFAHIVATLLG